MELDRTRRGIEAAKVLGATAAACALLLFLRVAPTRLERFYPPCLWKTATGLYCPGCGISRALVAFVNLEFVNAFMYNPFLFIIIIPLFVYLLIIYAARAVTGRWTPSILSSPKAAIPVLTAIAGIWILRNVFPPPQ